MLAEDSSTSYLLSARRLNPCPALPFISRQRHIKLSDRGNAPLFVTPATGPSIDMGDNTMLYAASICAAASLGLVLRWKSNGNRPPYPPGPRGYPLIGSVLEIPRDVPVWKGFIVMAEKLSRCLTPAGRHRRTNDAPLPRHGCAPPETFLTAFHRSE